MEHPQCHDLLGDLSAYLDGEASENVCAEIERHMESCANCRAVVNTLDKTVSLYQALPAPDVPSGVEERLLRVLRL